MNFQKNPSKGGVCSCVCTWMYACVYTRGQWQLLQRKAQPPLTIIERPPGWGAHSRGMPPWLSGLYQPFESCVPPTAQLSSPRDRGLGSPTSCKVGRDRSPRMRSRGKRRLHLGRLQKPHTQMPGGGTSQEQKAKGGGGRPQRIKLAPEPYVL